VSAVFIGSEIYRGSSYGGRHPLAIPRVSTVIDLARALGWLPPERWRTSPQARPAALTAFHTPDYVAALERAEAEQAVDPDTRARHGLGTLANPVFPEMFRRPATGAGGALLAAELVREGGVVHVPGAGTHHALADRAAGFCYLNDPVLCLLHLRRLGLSRIAYVDIDAHHMDGVQAALAGDPAFLLISTHEEGRWPFTGRLEDDGGGNALNLPLPRGLNDSEFAAVRDGLIRPALEAFEPEAIVAQCGADALAEDPLSRLALSNRAYLDHLAALRGAAPRLIVMGGGGYNPWSVARLWTALWGLLSGRTLPERLPPAAAEVLAALSWPGRAAGRNPPAHWRTTLIDAPNPGPVRPEVTRRIAALRARLPGLRERFARLAETRAALG
jgi:acetoin utilization protein AcuC